MSLLETGPHFHLTSDAALTELWSELMGKGGFGRRSLWLLFVDREQWTLRGRRPSCSRAWATALTRTARERGVPMWPLHLATYERLQLMAPDDLIGA